MRRPPFELCLYLLFTLPFWGSLVPWVSHSVESRVHKATPMPIEPARISPDASLESPWLACADTVMGKPFRGGRMLCLATASMAMVSDAIDDPKRAPAIAAQLEAMLVEAVAEQGKFQSTSVLYRGLLGMMLAGLHRIATPAVEWTTMMDELAAKLVDDLEDGWIASYPDGIWPCDHAPAAAFLRLHGDRDAADQLDGRLRDLLANGFPTRVDRKGRIVDGEIRTTPLAFTAAWLLAANPTLAADFAHAADRRCDPLGCREWARPHAGDAASGPIIHGYAIGATALAIVSSRALPDLDRNTELRRTATFAGGFLTREGTLEAALLLWGETARPWS